MTIWHPHTEHPAEDLTTAIIAIPPGPNDDHDQGAILAGVIHVWKRGQWVSETGELPLDATVFWWCAESYLLAELPAEAHERQPAAIDPRAALPTERECCGTFPKSQHRATCEHYRGAHPKAEA